MSRISISGAWEQTKALLARDGRLFASVALALIILPAVIAGVLDPQAASQDDAPTWFKVITVIVFLISVAGELALIRLALGPSVTVAGAISHGLRRLGPYMLSFAILLLGVIVVAIPFAIAAVAMGFEIEQGSPTALSGPVTMLVFVMLLLLLVLITRFFLAMPVASAERVGPIDMLKRSWELTDGHWLKLFLFLVLVLLAGMLIIGAVSMVAGSLALLAFGSVKPMTLAALLVSLINALFTGALSVVFTLMLTRIYVQLSGRDTVASAA